MTIVIMVSNVFYVTEIKPLRQKFFKNLLNLGSLHVHMHCDNCDVFIEKE